MLERVNTGFVNRVEKVWGRESWIVNNEKYCAKILHLKMGFICSLHYHVVKDETFYILFGKCMLEINDVLYSMGDGCSIRIRPGQVHRFWTDAIGGCEILEVSTPHSEEDVVRLEPSRKMVVT